MTDTPIYPQAADHGAADLSRETVFAANVGDGASAGADAAPASTP